MAIVSRVAVVMETQRVVGVAGTGSGAGAPLPARAAAAGCAAGHALWLAAFPAPLPAVAFQAVNPWILPLLPQSSAQTKQKNNQRLLLPPHPSYPAAAASFTASMVTSRLPAVSQVVEMEMLWQLLTVHDTGIIQASRGACALFAACRAGAQPAGRGAGACKRHCVLACGRLRLGKHTQRRLPAPAHCPPAF